jgi:23S rRNA pseudouridine1911/1915/1917 synthase
MMHPSNENNVESHPLMLEAGVLHAEAGMRLDRFLARRLADQGVARSRIQEWIAMGLAMVDDVPLAKPSIRLAAGSRVRLYGTLPPQSPEPVAGGLMVIYEDEDLLVVNKPPGLTVHPAPGEPGPTLVHRLLHHYPALSETGGERPGIVHRLDKDTSGAMAVALSPVARSGLVEAFADRRVGKAYLALVHGVPERGEDGIADPIGRHPSDRRRMAVLSEKRGGRPAASRYRVLWHTPDRAFSLLGVRIHTGRTHQIRVHLAHVGHPVVGDRVYGSRCFAKMERGRNDLARLCPRQMLHAVHLRLEHPLTRTPMAFTARAPRDMRRLALQAARNLQRVGLTGSPGSGKSTLAAILEQKGVPVFSADACVAGLYEPGADGWLLLRARFGSRFTPCDTEPVDKKRLFAAMTTDPGLRREVMHLVHPLVAARLEEFFQANRCRRVAVAEIPLLLEAGEPFLKMVDVVVGIRATGYDRRDRLVGERGLPPQAADALESWQWPEDRKLAACDLVVDNPGHRRGLEHESGDMLARLRRLRGRHTVGLVRELSAIWDGSGWLAGFFPDYEQISVHDHRNVK